MSNRLQAYGMSFDMKYGVLQVLNTCIVFYRLAGFKYVLVHFDPWIPPSDISSNTPVNRL